MHPINVGLFEEEAIAAHIRRFIPAAVDFVVFL
jgi:hypothetical protein